VSKLSRLIKCTCGTVTKEGAIVVLCEQCVTRGIPEASVLKEEREKERVAKQRRIRKHGKKGRER